MYPHLPQRVKLIWRYLEKEIAEGRGDVIHNFDYPIFVLSIDGQTKRLPSTPLRATHPFCFDPSTDRRRERTFSIGDDCELVNK
jgi:hypothetical protein